MAKSTTDQLSIFDLPTLAPPSAISSQELAAGPSPSTSRAGPATAKSGPRASPANHSQLRAKAKDTPTSATFGPPSTPSSSSADLQSSLENRLRARLEGRGSPLYGLTWKRLDMPSLPPCCQLAASAPRIGATDFSGSRIAWPRDGKGGYQGGRIRNGEISTDTLDVTAQLASWPTPTAGNADGSQAANASPTGKRADGSKATVALPAIARLASWPTARASDGEKNVRTLEGSLAEIARKGSPQDLAQAAALGPISNGSTAATKNGGQLNPLFSLWLMGFPTVWASCAPQATPSSPRSRRNSSKAILT